MARTTANKKSTKRQARTRPNVMTLVEYAAGEIREQILSGEMAADERILLDEVAEDLGISQIPLREALRTLATEGLVAPLPRRGYTVAPVTVADLEETYRVRLVLEPLAVQLAVPVLTPENIDQLRKELEQLDVATAAEDWPAHRLHHRAFHFGIYEKCNSSWLIRFTDMLWANSDRYQRMTTQIRGELGDRMVEHRAVLDACARGEAEEAGERMHEHLEHAFTTLREYLVARSSGGSRSSKSQPEAPQST
jgi:DNA-binding GntR family transcriptional regulator